MNRRRKTERSEAREIESTRLIEQIAGAIGRLTLGDGAVSPEIGLGLLDVYARVTGDSVLSAFARGALEHRASGDAEKKKSAEEKAAEEKKTGSDLVGHTATLGVTYSLDDYRAAARKASVEKIDRERYADFLGTPASARTEKSR